MNKFGPVAPIQVLEGLFAHSPETFGNYHLLLAHHTVAHKKRFADLFKQVSDHGMPGPVKVIMDNSIVELGSAVDAEMIIDAVNTISFPGIDVYPVLPDVMGKGEETRQATAAAYANWVEEMPGEGFMVVCQGIDYQDYLTSVGFFTNRARFEKVKILGIPRVLTKIIGSRVRPALVAKEYLNTHEIHFLGFSDNVVDDIDSVRCIEGAGIDSAVPLRVREVFTEFLDAGARPTDWFETAQVDGRMIENLQIARQLFGDQ